MASELTLGKSASIGSSAGGLVRVFVFLALPTLILPWFVPAQPARSISYLQGFSNPAFWGLLVAGFIAPAFQRFKSSSNRLPVLRASCCAQAAGRRRAWWLFMGLCALLLILCWNLAGYGDAEYFLVRANLVQAGKVPYRDFEFAYGPLLLYAPLALERLGMPPGPSLALMVVLQSAIGYLALAFIVRSVFGPAPAGGAATTAALICATAPSVLIAGENYTFLRFAAAAAIACWVLQRRSASGERAAALAAGPLFVAAWLLSPEVAIAVSFAFTIVLVATSRRRTASAAIALAAILACAASTPLVKESYRTLLAFGGGGNNFPAYPAIHILFFLLCIFLATAHISQYRVREAPNDWFLFLYSIALIPGAFGRCDPLHTIFYGFGFVILAAKFCWTREFWEPRRFLSTFVWIASLTWLALFAGIYPFKLATVVLRTTFAAATLLVPESSLPASFTAPMRQFAKADDWSADVPTEPSDDSVVFQPRSDLGVQVIRRSGFFVALENATNRAAYERIGAELRGKRALVRTAGVDNMCSPMLTEFGSILFIFPTGIFASRNDPLVLSRDLCARLRSATVIQEHGRYMEVQVPG